MSARRASSPVGSTARASATAKARWAAVSSATATPEIATFAAVLSASGPTARPIEIATSVSAGSFAPGSIA